MFWWCAYIMRWPVSKPDQWRGEAPSRWRGRPYTHREHLLRSPLCSHVGVMDLLENHPGFIMFAHLVRPRKETWEIRHWWLGRPSLRWRNMDSLLFRACERPGQVSVPSPWWKDNQVVPTRCKCSVLISLYTGVTTHSCKTEWIAGWESFLTDRVKQSESNCVPPPAPHPKDMLKS